MCYGNFAARLSACDASLSPICGLPVSAVSLSPQRRRCSLYAHFHLGNITHVEVALFLRELLRHLKGDIIVLWDGGSVHAGADVRDLLAKHSRLHVERFPAYAPELNPDELAWSYLKRRLANAGPDDIEELLDALSKEARRLKKLPKILRAFITGSDLPTFFDQNFLLLMQWSIKYLFTMLKTGGLNRLSPGRAGNLRAAVRPVLGCSRRGDPALVRATVLERGHDCGGRARRVHRGGGCLLQLRSAPDRSALSAMSISQLTRGAASTLQTRAATGIALSCLLALAPSALAATFEPLPHPGGLRSEPVAVSGDGRFVLVNVFQEPTSGHIPPSYRWDNGVVEPIPCIFANDMSDDGKTIAAQCNNLQGERRLWVDGALVDLPAGYRYAAALTAVSGDGLVVFGIRNYEYCQEPDLCHDPFQAFRLANGVAQDLGFLPGDHASLVTGASYDGTVAAFVSHLQDIRPGTEEDHGPFKSDLSHAVRWKASALPPGSLLPLAPFAEQSNVNEVSSDGTTLVGNWYRWTEATGLVFLDFPPDTESAHATGVSGDGRVIVGSYETPAYPDGRASIWRQETGLLDLNDLLVNDLNVDLDGWELLTATDISTDASTIVGLGIDPVSGLVSGWRVGLADTTIVVTVTGDEPNDAASKAANVCDVELGEEGLQCTLRAAIELANERGGGTIKFDIPGNGVPRIEVINYTVPYSAADGTGEGLPRITTRITLDGTTQPGGLVELAGPSVGEVGMNGLRIATGGEHSEIRGLVMNGFMDGALIVEADSCTIEGNRIGTDSTGTQRGGNTGSFYADLINPTLGLVVKASQTRIANNILAANEILSFNGLLRQGVQVAVDGNSNVVVGNRIGVGADGLVIGRPPRDPEFGPGSVGLKITGSGTVVGGATPDGEPPDACVDSCNLIAGNDLDVAVLGDSPASGLLSFVGNWVGVDATGEPFPAEPTPTGGSHGVISEGAVVVESNLVRCEGQGITAGNGARVVGNIVRGRAEFPYNTSIVLREALVTVQGEGVEVRDNEIRSYTNLGISVEGIDHRIEHNEIADNPLGGVLVLGGSGHVIIENDIHDNLRAGVVVNHRAFSFEFSGAQASITANRIYDNGIGIDLDDSDFVQLPEGFHIVGDGVTLNDVGDGDTGPNDFQNFPNLLSASIVGPDVRLDGFIETSPFTSALHRIEVFGGSGCHSDSTLGGMQYGQGQEYLGSYEAVPGLADLDFSIDVFFPGGVGGTSISHVSLTATRVDRGSTSEFSRCVAIAAAGDVASADVPADGNGPVLDDRGVTVSVGSGAAAPRRSVGAATGGAGKLFVTRYERAPDLSVFADEVATGFGGTDVKPGAVAPRYWYIADRGLTAAGGATAGTRTFDVCLDPTGVVQPDDTPTVVVVQRNETTGGVWVPHDTTQAPHGDTDYLCASGLTELGEFGLGMTALCGDLNDSGTITASDALLILKASVGGNQCAEKLCACDVNASGTITASDALATLKSAVTQTALDSCPC